MSRTVRRKNRKDEYYWVLREFTHIDKIPSDLSKYDKIAVARWASSDNWVDIHFSPQSKAGKKRISRYHSDAGTHKCKEPGPSWYRRLNTQKPLRQSSRMQLQQFLKDPELEVIIDNMPPLGYWT
jgi:hypothetical protein